MTTTTSYVVEITDEHDALVGYGVCTEGPEGFAMLPTVYPVRSEAHAAVAKAAWAKRMTASTGRDD